MRSDVWDKLSYIHEITADDLYKFVNLKAWEFVI